jgi:hypothetical protein
MDRALLSGLLIAEIVADPRFANARGEDEGAGRKGLAPSGMRLSVKSATGGTQIGLELSYPRAGDEATVTNFSNRLLGILEDELGAAVSIDSRERRIAASFFIAADVPDASTRPWPIARASRTEKSWSTVRILPLNRTVSAVWAEATATCEAKQKAAMTARLPTIILLAWLPEPDMSPLPLDALSHMFCREIAGFGRAVSNRMSFKSRSF